MTTKKIWEAMQCLVSESGSISTRGQRSSSRAMTSIQSEMIKDKVLGSSEWPAMSPDLNPKEHLWRDLKTAAGRRRPSKNLKDLVQFAKEEQSKIPVERCKKHVHGGEFG